MPIILFAELLLLNVSGAHVEINGNLSQAQVGEIITADSIEIHGAMVSVNMIEIPKSNTIYISSDSSGVLVIEINKALPQPPNLMCQ